jgi:hypothetical protein
MLSVVVSPTVVAAVVSVGSDVGVALVVSVAVASAS